MKGVKSGRRFADDAAPTRLIFGLGVMLVSSCTLTIPPDDNDNDNEDPVTIEITLDGDPDPGAALTATAEVTINDGSTQESIAWTAESTVAVTVQGADSETAGVTLPSTSVYKETLFGILAEPPIGEDELPPNVPLPDGEFPGGLQDRFHVVGLNPFSLEETGLLALTATVTTSSGTYTEEFEIHPNLPWKVSSGIRNVPVGQAVLLHGKTQNSYDWSLDAPAGSSATLADATSQNPYFTPDAAGRYTVTVTDQTGDAPAEVTIDIFAGTWVGVITGQDADGRPQASSNCTGCHSGTIAPDKFTPWAQTGHAEIFTDNLNTSTHYGEDCFTCHTVGFDPDVENGGVDEADDYPDFLDAGLINTPSDDNWTTVLSDFARTAQQANIQCENCHGPQSSQAHMGGASRITLSSDGCATCHGEPLRHARFQQWQLSGHANYELAIDEGESGGCARCHTVNGFLAWLPVLLDNDPATDPLADIEVTWTADETHPQTCVTCHDPHSIGTTTGEETNATIRITGDTPPLIAGFTATDVGRGAICMTCHNTRRGLRNDDNFAAQPAGDRSRAPHPGAQADVLMGQNAYFVDVGTRGSHSVISDTCVNCHMVQTDPPELLSYEQGGTNHTFFASTTICADCHGGTFTYGNLAASFTTDMNELQELIETALLQLITAQIAAGNTLDLDGEATITSAADITALEFTEASGRQAITVTLAGGTTVGPVGLNNVSVLDGGGTSLGDLASVADDRLIKAGWNWNLLTSDASESAHNFTFVSAVLDASIDQVTTLTTAGGGGGS